MAHNLLLKERTADDIDRRVAKVLRGLGNPEPPLRLDDVRELLKLDRAYYTSTDEGFLSEIVSRLKIAGKQIVRRPSLLRDAIIKFDLKALYLPDRRRILIDNALPRAKHRWVEGHETGHHLLPWHQETMLGDDRMTLAVGCHEQMEAEANFAAGQLLFLRDRFKQQANDGEPLLERIRGELKQDFGNTITTTLWRFIEQTHAHLPMVGAISPHPINQLEQIDVAHPMRYFIRSPLFAEHFSGVTEHDVFRAMIGYCTGRRAGPLGEDEVLLTDDRDEQHLFRFESFFNSYDTLTLGVYLAPASKTFGPSA
ncbi:MAG: ImmA/IrrE family metallo-endopeptidase [Chromatiaceae bacterium]|nr:ImmA/IrrE family metallo-endopeptidase [Chromatiaceae bacterium]MCF7993727.1 ImmA/IrrE family metallo-endopeptidase [Chromatiaceae bacterium]MCF8004047.1 ImmA/IrrE family metallo-endopeptidase [Chromatiaceae bacterium]MCF8016787.1 ImmA/IrrE family metallo-endopeptidase [Chromatiaceae bacterium]